MKIAVDDLRLLCRIIETGSLRAAAEEIGTDPSSVTRRLSSIEQRLGVRLINRSRVRSAATDAGRKYYSELKPLLERLTAIEEEIAGAAIEPRGLLRVAAPNIFGARHISPWLHELQLQAPKVEIDLVLADRPVDLIENDVDIAVRIGRLRDSSLIALRLGTMLTAVVASPRYLARAGMPKRPQDLEHHALVLHAGPLQSEELVLAGPKGRTVTVKCTARFSASNILAVMEAVIAGAGFNAGPLWLFADAIARGDLVQILPGWGPPRGAVHAVMPPGRFRPAKTTAVLEMLRARIPKLQGVIA